MNKVALITGGQRGIGLGIALALAQDGFRIAIASLPSEDDGQVQKAVKQLNALTSCHYYQLDVAKADTQSDALLDQIEADLGPVTSLVNNAGIGSPVRGDLMEVLPENWDFVMDVNLKGAFFLAQATARRMLSHAARCTDPSSSLPYRSISFVTSVSADLVSVERAEYCVSKSAASMVVKLFASRLARDGIGVFELRPGIIATELTAGVKEKYDAQIADGLVPSGRWGEPSDIGAALLPLVRGDLAFSTGTSIPVDGGLSIQRL